MPTIKQKEAFKAILENHGNISQGMIKVGYKPTTAKTPKNLTDSDGWKELMDEYLSDESIAEKHKQLLEASGIGHMVFPLKVTDEDIIELLAEANCIVKRLMHSETQTHVWYFAPDNNARKAALDMAYKLKGKYAPQKLEHTGKDGQDLFKADGKTREKIKKTLGAFPVLEDNERQGQPSVRLSE